MTTHHCLVCGHPTTHHVDPTDHLFAVPSIEVHGCHISAVIEHDEVAEIVDWQLSESPAAIKENSRIQPTQGGRGWP